MMEIIIVAAIAAGIVIVALVTYGLRRALGPEEEARQRQVLLSLLFKYPFSL